MKMHLRLIATVSILAGGLMSAASASAQFEGLDRAQTLLLSQGLYGEEGARLVSAQFAECFGFQSELYNHFTRQIEGEIEDIELYDEISRQSLRAGLISIILIDPAATATCHGHCRSRPRGMET